MKVFLLVLLSTFPVVLQAQERTLHFINYTNKNGLPNAFITELYQDKSGFIWVGTNNGLSRFDGTEFRNFYYNPADKKSLSGNRIFDVEEDTQGNIWVATNHGLSCYLKDKEYFKQYLYRPEDPHSLSNDLVYDVFSDKQGTIWACTDAGLSRYDPDHDHFDRFFNTKSKDYELANRFSSIYQDKEGKLWVAPQLEGIYRFDPHDGSFEHQQIEGIHFQKNINPNSKLIYIDADNTFWIGTRGNGFFRFDPQTKKVVRFHSNPGHPGLNNNIVFEFADLTPDELWIGTDGGGINILNKKTNTFRYIMANRNSSNGLRSNATQVFLKDCQNNIWIGTVTDGLFVYNSFLNFFEQYRWSMDSPVKLTNNVIIEIYQDKAGTIWIGTDGGGLNSFNRTTGQFKAYACNPLDNHSISSNVICGMLEDKAGNFWVGTFAQGLNKFDRTTGKAIRYMPVVNDSTSLSNENIWDIKQDKRGNLWVATLGGGLNKFNYATGHFKRYMHKRGNPNTLINDIINGITEDHRGNIWISTENGLSVFDPVKETFNTLTLRKPGLNIDFTELHCIITDTKGYIWIGASWGGLFKVDPVTLKSAFYDFSNGKINNSVLSLVEDESGNIWGSTIHGLGCLDLKSGKVQFYDERDGLPSSMFTQTASIRLKSGDLAVGSNDGFIIFNPKDIHAYPYPPILLITDFRLHDKSVLPGTMINKHVVLEKPVYNADQVNLSYREHEFSISFSALQFVNQRKCQVYYKLEGYDNGWRAANMNSKNITYTYLPPASYIFMLRADNGDGVWSKVKTLRIIITPPFWDTLWFKILSLLALSGLIYLLVFLNSLRLTKRRKLLETIVTRRTHDLAEANALIEERQKEVMHQNEELYALNQTLELQKQEIRLQNQALDNSKQELEAIVQQRTQALQIALTKAMESEKLKSAFLANMSHEIRTPMNAILGFSGLLAENMDVTSKTSRYIKIIQSSSKTLMVLIDDIVDFSKIEAGILEFYATEFDFYTLLEEVYTLFKMENDRPQIELEFECNCSPELMLLTDRVRTRQILVNFMTNALKYTDRGKVTLGCRFKGKDIIVYVEDSGIGISSDKFEFIFKPFNKIEETPERLTRGAGLGLAICNHLATKMEYSLWVESTPGIGSTFYLKIPESKRIFSGIKEESAITISIDAVYKDKTILIAEDEENNYLFIETLLEKSEVKLIWARNGMECIEMVQKNPTIDLILMDIKMPLLNGSDANKQLKELGFKIPTIAVTAYATPADRQRFMEEKFEGYLVKPVKATVLMEEIHKWLA